MEKKKNFSNVAPPADEKCREEILRMLGDVDATLDGLVEDLQTKEPTIVDPIDEKLSYMREISELAGQRMLIEGLKNALQKPE